MGRIDPPTRSFQLLVESIDEPERNSLRVVLRESMYGERVSAEGLAEKDSMPVGLLAGARPLRKTEADRIFEVFWNVYVVYYVLNESFVKPLTDGTWEGDYPLKYSRDSDLLAYVKNHSIASDSYPGRLTHWSIGSGDHIVEVIASEKPIVRELNAV
ncbi:MAG: hypothetical protein AAFR07_16055 [Pseudomonadota bacterium]